jgi:hypothetical protein
MRAVRIAIRAPIRVGARRGLPVAVRTVDLSRRRRGGCASRAVVAGACPPATANAEAVRDCGSVRAVTPFYVCGIALAVWALVVTFIGVTRDGFPESSGAERMVGLVSVVLVVAAIATAIYGAANEEHGEEGEEGEEAALVLPI